MQYNMWVGSIKPERKKTWSNNKDPFDILEDNKKDITNIDWLTFFSAARKCFKNEVQIDWGSFAFTTTKKQLEKFVKRSKCNIEDLDKLPDKHLGVVFIEMR